MQHLLCCMHNIPAPAIIGSDGEGQAGIIGGELLRLFNMAIKLKIETAEIADHFKTDIILVQLFDFTLQHLEKQLHQE